jgi:TonB-linked SusC/RagA family outer membrane protein
MIGKVAGLDIRAKTNLFENPEIYLRGEETLIVIDGVPTEKGNFDFWNINANDIESINVLKGTAAAALYGSLGINGAIMITTKKGKSGGKGLEVVYNSTTQFQAGYMMIPKTQTEYGMGSGGYYAFIDGKSGGGWNDDYGYVYGPKLNVPNSANPSGFEEYPQYNSPYDPNTLFPFTQNGFSDVSNYKPLPWITRGKNNIKNFLDNEFMTSQNIAIAGKGDNSDYRISVTHMYQKGQVPNTHLNSTTLNLAGSLRPTEKLKLEAVLSYNKQYTPNYPQVSYGANNFFYNLLLWMGPDVDVRDLRDYWKPAGGRTTPAGTYVPYGVENVQQFNYNYTWYNNPWYLAYEALNGYNNDVITGQLNANYEFTKNLSFYVRSGIITNFALSTLKTPKSYVYYGNTELDGNYSERRNSNFQIVTDALFTYKTQFFKDFSLTASAGASSRYNNNSYLSSRTNGLNVPVLYNLDNTVGPVVSANRRAERKINSVFGYIDADYKQMVFLGATARQDYTSTLQKPNNSYFYPSASLGIVPTSMVKFPQFISYLKFRGSWASISTDRIEIQDNPNEGIYRDWYATLPVFAPGPRWNGNSASLNLPGLLIKEGLKPNKTVSLEYGAEIRFLKNRLGVDFTYFSYMDKDFAIEAPVSTASGFNDQLVNGDRINRRGVELVLSGSPIRNNVFRWDITANYSTVHSYVKEYYGGAQIREAIKVGERIDVMRDWDWQRSPDGQIVYGSNGFPAYIDHIVNIGLTDPDFIFGLNNSFNYKNFGFSFSFDGRIGGIMYNGVENKLYEGGMHPGTANKFRDDANAGNNTFVGPGVVVTSGSVDYDIQGNAISDTRKFAPNTQAVNYVTWIFQTYVNGIPGANVMKNSFVKLREIVFTYNVSEKLLRKTPFKGGSISVTGRNIALFTDVPFVDPDGSNGGLAEPAYRNIGVNLNLKF